MPKIKVISVNIEGSKHLDEIEEFVLAEQPDVVCIQELFEQDLPRIEEKTGWKGFFSPIASVSKENPYKIPTNGPWGLGFFSKWSLAPIENYFYRGEEDSLVPIFSHPNSVNRIVMKTAVEVEGSEFPIANTHFTWSVGGQVTQEQRHHLRKMKAILAEFDSLILCGDFNTPRGKELYSELSALYQDALPPEVDTTIDPVLHQAGGLKLVVDAVFATSDFEILRARTQSGISDHQALIVEIQKKS